ncbi:GtrA family protein [Trueperella bernardiae]|uniref:GtrA family protein n=1 Tax=Trueperella bernardiae TaxID=59561 RepID=UPI002043B374|nr:GtrA family protein [Trueperella bernardiae]MCM3907168.1 GtrA family protein [Trueperella bernardiae]
MHDLTTKLLRGQSFKRWLVEFIQFCTVGLGSYVVDVGLFNFLAYSGVVHLPGDAPMVAKTLSVFVSIIFSWVVNRLWTFRNKSDKSRGQEFVLFLAINIGGLLIALGCLGFSRYILGLDSQLADNISANGVGLVLGTAFRYVCYRYLVFTKAPAADESR